MPNAQVSAESHEVSREGGQPGLLVAGSLVVLAVVLGALYWKILRDLAYQWWDDANYSHGFIVPLFSIYVLWTQRATLSKLMRSGSLIGLPVILAGIGMLILGDLGSENFLMRSSFLVIIAGLILFHLGTRIFRAVLFPLAFLLFMVPLPGVLFYAV